MFKRGGGGGKQFKAPKKSKAAKAAGAKDMAFYVIVLGIFVLAVVAQAIFVRSYTKEVAVVSFAHDIGAKIIEEQDIAPYKLASKDVKPEMVLWSDRNDPEKGVVDKYTNMQIRPNTPIYEDQIVEEPLLRYKYLYELAPNEELLTFNYDNIEAGGRIPKPGDRFRIRGSYTLGEGEKDPETGQVVAAGTDEVKTSIVFDVVTVVDMLNSNGDSVHETMRELERLTASEREKLAEDDSFKDLVAPHSLLVIAESDQIGKYVEFDAKKNAKYTLTLLTRDKEMMEDDIKSGTSILDGEVRDKINEVNNEFDEVEVDLDDGGN